MSLSQCQRSKFVEILHNLRTRPVRRESEFAAYHAITIDDRRLRITCSAIQIVAFLICVEYRQEVDAVFAEEGMIHGILGIYRNADHGDFVTHALLQLDQRRHFRDTRLAVRRPEIQYHNLSTVIMQGYCVV